MNPAQPKIHIFSRSILFLLLSQFFACAQPDKPRVDWRSVASSNDSILLTGRIATYGDSAVLYWPGSKIRFKFRGTSAKIIMSDELGQNYFNIIIDGDSIRHVRLNRNRFAYQVALNLPEGEHTIEFIKRTEWDKGAATFYGLEVDGPLIAIERPKRMIEFFGNSITAGYAINDKSGRDSPDSVNTDNYYTYASLTARHFGADQILTIKSGIGMLISWFPLVMPEMYERLDPRDSSSRWDFHLQPQVVVINLFQNDSWLILKPQHPSFKARFGDKPPGPHEIVAAYYKFLRNIRDHYPNAYIICSLGSMDAVKPGSPWPGYVTNAVSRLNDPKVDALFFPYLPRNGHPTLDDNKVMADILIKHIEARIAW